MSALTRALGTEVNGTVGTTAAVALVANTGRNFLTIQNTSASNSLSFTVDGSTPISTSKGFLLSAAGGAVTFDVFVPTGAITVIGSAAGTTYELLWA